MEKYKTGVSTPDPADIAIAEAKGLILAAHIVLKNVNKPSETGVVSNEVIAQGVFVAVNEINRETQNRHDMAKEHTRDLREKLKRLTSR